VKFQELARFSLSPRGLEKEMKNKKPPFREAGSGITKEFFRGYLTSYSDPEARKKTKCRN